MKGKKLLKIKLCGKSILVYDRIFVKSKKT